MSPSQPSIVAATSSQQARVSQPVEIDASLLHLIVGGTAEQGPVGGWLVAGSESGPVGGW